MGNGKIQWDDAAIRMACANAARPAVEAETERIAAAASSLSAGYRTGLYHRGGKSPAVGNTPTNYRSDLHDYKGMPVGIVYTGNYSAMKDNAENNTLLKARG